MLLIGSAGCIERIGVSRIRQPLLRRFDIRRWRVGWSRLGARASLEHEKDPFQRQPAIVAARGDGQVLPVVGDGAQVARGQIIDLDLTQFFSGGAVQHLHGVPVAGHDDCALGVTADRHRAGGGRQRNQARLQCSPHCLKIGRGIGSVVQSLQGLVQFRWDHRRSARLRLVFVDGHDTTAKAEL
jgi:hypothetical protein